MNELTQYHHLVSRILLVDDSTVTRKMHKRMIESSLDRTGLRDIVAIDSAADGFEACRLIQTLSLESETYLFIAMDLSMPKIDGQSTTEIVKTALHACAETPIVALSAMNPREAALSLTQDYFCRFIQKPLAKADADALVATYVLPFCVSPSSPAPKSGTCGGGDDNSDANFKSSGQDSRSREFPAINKNSLAEVQRALILSFECLGLSASDLSLHNNAVRASLNKDRFEVVNVGPRAADAVAWLSSSPRLPDVVLLAISARGLVRSSSSSSSSSFSPSSSSSAGTEATSAANQSSQGPPEVLSRAIVDGIHGDLANLDAFQICRYLRHVLQRSTPTVMIVFDAAVHACDKLNETTESGNFSVPCRASDDAGNDESDCYVNEEEYDTVNGGGGEFGHFTCSSTATSSSWEDFALGGTLGSKDEEYSTTCFPSRHYSEDSSCKVLNGDRNGNREALWKSRALVAALWAHGQEEGCNECLTAPYSAAELKGRVETCLESKRLQEVEAEHEKYRELLHEMMPPHIVKRLVAGEKHMSESHPSVTILFSDIVGWTTIAAALPTAGVVRLLDHLFGIFDSLTAQFGVFKVETIGDAYMVASGHDEESSSDHAERVLRFANAMLDASNACPPSLLPAGTRLQIRVGIHTGPAHTGVVGNKVPRFCFFGDTVNVASRMESHGVPGALHLSVSTVEALRAKSQAQGDHQICSSFATSIELCDKYFMSEVLAPFVGDVSILPRQAVDIKGKGKMATVLVYPQNLVLDQWNISLNDRNVRGSDWATDPATTVLQTLKRASGMRGTPSKSLSDGNLASFFRRRHREQQLDMHRECLAQPQTAVDLNNSTDTTNSTVKLTKMKRPRHHVVQRDVAKRAAATQALRFRDAQSALEAHTQTNNQSCLRTALSALERIATGDFYDGTDLTARASSGTSAAGPNPLPLPADTCESRAAQFARNTLRSLTNGAGIQNRKWKRPLALEKNIPSKSKKKHLSCTSG